MSHFTHKTPKGFSLLELTLGIGLFMIFAIGLGTTAIGGHLTSLENAKSAKANALIVESWEAVKAIRNHAWSDISNGNHGLSSASGVWEFLGVSDSSDGFTRVVSVSEVRRDESGNIVFVGGEADPDTKLVTYAISWAPSAGQSRSLAFESYITNYSGAGAWPIPPPAP